MRNAWIIRTLVGARAGAGSLVLGVTFSALLVGCLSGPGGATRSDRHSVQEPTHLMLFGQVAYPVPRAEADPDLLAIWSEAQELIRRPLFDMGDDDDGLLATVISVVQAYHVQVNRVLEQLEDRAYWSREDRLLDLLARGALFEHLARQLRAVPMPGNWAGNQVGEAVFQKMMDQLVSHAARGAQGAYLTCARQASDPWEEICAARAKGLSVLVNLLADWIESSLAPPN